MTKNNNDLGLFAGLLFDDENNKSPKTEEVKKENNKEKIVSTKKNEKNKEQLPVNKTRIVCYAGHKVYIENRNLSLEQIRKQLEKEFPELSKGRTEMAYDDKTGVVVPIIKAKKNGGV